MVGFLGLFGLFILITLVMPWIQAARLRRLDDDIQDLRTRLSQIEGATTHTVTRSRVADQADETTSVLESDPSILLHPVYISHPEENNIAQSDIPAPVPQIEHQVEEGKGFEFNLAAKLPVWIGSLSLICAGFFLVKYSIDAGWLGPLPRVILGGMMGLSMLIGGQWLSRQNHIDNHTRIAQGAIGAGLVTLYFSTYAAVNLYHLIPDFMGFALMAMVTAGAIILSIRHGQVIAVFGLFGGLLTPALIASSEPNAAALFTYLFILFAGLMFTLARHGWWITAAATLVGMYVWMALFISSAFLATDTSVLILFITATCAVASLATQYAGPISEKQPLYDIRPYFNMAAVAAGLITILILNARVTLSLFDWSLLGLLSIGGVSLTFFKPDIYRVPVLGQMALTLVLFGLWSDHVPFAESAMVALGLVGIYGAMTYALMRQISNPLPLAILQTVGLIGLYVVGHYQMNMPPDALSYHPWAIIGLVLMGYFAYQTLQMRRTYLADQTQQDYLVATYALGSTASLSLAMIFTLPGAYLPLAFSAQIAAAMWVHTRTPMMALPRIIVALIVAGLIFNADYLSMFIDTIFSSLFDDPSYGGRRLATLPFDQVMIHVVLPTTFLGIVAALYQTCHTTAPTSLGKWIYGTVIGHVLALVYILIRHAFVDMDSSHYMYSTPEAGFIERGFITATIALFGLALIQIKKYAVNNRTLIQYGRLMIAVAVARLAYFDLFIHNPYFHSDQDVGSWLVVNGITLTYGLGGMLILGIISLAEFAPHQMARRNALKILAGIMLFMFVSMTIRHYFHGNVLSGYPTSPEEFYTYSIVWLLTGIGLLLVGLAAGNQGARQASLAFMVLTVGKVFLFDADELEGLYRVFSFLGLGVSLMGLSFLYTKALKGQTEKREEKSGPWWF